MESIGANCQELKKQYDDCFNNWFSERYLKGDYHSDMCSPLFESYQSCVKEAIQNKGIDLWEITEKGEIKKQQQQHSSSPSSTISSSNNENH